MRYFNRSTEYFRRHVYTLDVIAFFLGISLAIIFVAQFIAGYDKGSWNITEWLINYEGGFIRRGFSGQIILAAHERFGIDPYILIVSSCAVFYLVLCYILVKKAYSERFPIILLPGAYLLGGPIVNDFWVRKDVFLLLCFIGVVQAIKSVPKFRILIINILCIVAILCHESFGFWGLSTLMFISSLNSAICSGEKYKINHCVLALASFMPSVFVFCICLYFKGDIDAANTIWTSWENIPFPKTGPLDMVPPAAINGLSWTLAQGMSLTLYLFGKFSYGIYVPLGVLITLMSVYLIISNAPGLRDFNSLETTTRSTVVKSFFRKDILAKWLVIQLAVISPLFILGWDYGRWIFIWVITALTLYLILPIELHDKMRKLRVWKVLVRPGRYSVPVLSLLIWKMIRWYTLTSAKFRFWTLLYIITGVSMVGWDLISFLATSPMGILWQIVQLLSYGSLFKLPA